MGQTIDRLFLEFSSKKLEQLLARIETCLDKLNTDQVWARGTENENAIGNLVLHLSGNVRQWIVSGVGGRPDVRVRDREFSARGDIEVSELMERLKGSVGEALAVLDKVTADRLSQTVHIQNYDISVLEAIAHVVEHFSQHTGQIIFATKMLTGDDLGFYRHLRSAAAHGEKAP
jgi:uncharacterized damage-inducible protein DinB